MNITTRISKHVKQTLLKAITDAEGNEVFAAGYLCEDGIVQKIKVLTRGTEDEVLVHPESFESHVLIHNHPSGILLPSAQDSIIAQRCAYNARGFYIVNNTVDKIYVVVEPVYNKKIQLLDSCKIAKYLSAGGALSKQTDYFEERPSQIELLQTMCEAFNNNNIGVFEAGTGVGKSYAYLIPAILWALDNKERVVISTGTINLQQQLFEKDIPATTKLLNKPVKAVLVKGRQNFVCLRRLHDALGEKDLFSDENEELERIFEWTKNTKTGSKSDVSFMLKESIWQRINSESDACMGMRCSYHSQCFVMHMRKAASEAHLLVVNHHILFADIEMRLSVGYDDTAVLPPYK
ncbi:MAG TPA: JAB domain-containing protein, partial [Treponemataceae bacterium]|nr:JAB domain-containing protein [Treponemataceae bacterium]